ncbi:MAG TPA: hypothetical protein VHY19_06875 [Steroidobacteraceae bacterium]|jgi:hypothetical protein|nr:hypothetical protein [Steroidobacteraceae bacterium]
MSAVTEEAIGRALALLEGASDSWRNGDPGADGSLHWPVAVH